jgi:hypothetical protein
MTNALSREVEGKEDVLQDLALQIDELRELVSLSFCRTKIRYGFEFGCRDDPNNETGTQELDTIIYLFVDWVFSKLSAYHDGAKYPPYISVTSLNNSYVSFDLTSSWKGFPNFLCTAFKNFADFYARECNVITEDALELDDEFMNNIQISLSLEFTHRKTSTEHGWNFVSTSYNRWEDLAEPILKSVSDLSIFRNNLPVEVKYEIQLRGSQLGNPDNIQTLISEDEAESDPRGAICSFLQMYYQCALHDCLIFKVV